MHGDGPYGACRCDGAFLSGGCGIDKFTNGVAFYTEGTVTLYFPEFETVCRHCILLEHDYKLERVRCRRTGEIIPAPDVMRGQFCPVKFRK